LLVTHSAYLSRVQYIINLVVRNNAASVANNSFPSGIVSSSTNGDRPTVRKDQPAWKGMSKKHPEGEWDSEACWVSDLREASVVNLGMDKISQQGFDSDDEELCRQLNWRGPDKPPPVPKPELKPSTTYAKAKSKASSMSAAELEARKAEIARNVEIARATKQAEEMRVAGVGAGVGAGAGAGTATKSIAIEKVSSPAVGVSAPAEASPDVSYDRNGSPNHQVSNLSLRVGPPLPRLPITVSSATMTSTAGIAAVAAAGGGGDDAGSEYRCANCGTAFEYGSNTLRCSRCAQDDAMYCDKKCQVADWSRHGPLCNPKTGQGNRAFSGGNYYVWITPEVPAVVWRQADIDKMAGDPSMEDSFAMDPPERLRFEHPRLFDSWFPREFYIGEDLMFEASFLPAKMIAAIRAGLRKKKLCWDYLVQDNFFSVVTHAAMPVNKTMIYINSIMQVCEPKPHASRLLETELERMWIIATTQGHTGFKQDMCDILESNEIHRNDISWCGESCDDFRLVSHRSMPICDCYFCQSRPLLEVRKKKIWENFRLDSRKRGVHVMSYQQYTEINNEQVNPAVWDAGMRALQAAAEQKEQKRLLGRNYRLPKLQKGEMRLGAGAKVLIDSPYLPDDTINFNAVAPANMKKICACLDVAKKEKRLPTHAELDLVMLLLKAGMREPPVEKVAALKPVAVAAAGAGAGAGTGAGAGAGAAAGAGKLSPSSSSAATTSTATAADVTAVGRPKRA